MQFLREPDLNRRPLGYEPNELPTALSRYVKGQFLKGYCPKPVKGNVNNERPNGKEALGDPAGIRTRDATVKGWWLNHLPTGPLLRFLFLLLRLSEVLQPNSVQLIMFYPFGTSFSKCEEHEGVNQLTSLSISQTFRLISRWQEIKVNALSYLCGGILMVTSAGFEPTTLP